MEEQEKIRLLEKIIELQGSPIQAQYVICPSRPADPWYPWHPWYSNPSTGYPPPSSFYYYS